MGEKVRNEGLEQMASRYDEIVASINELSLKIRKKIKRYDPLYLLARVADHTQMLQIRCVGATQNDNPFSLRGIEYIQSVLAAIRDEIGNEEPDYNTLIELLSDIENINLQTSIFYASWAAKESLESRTLSDDDIDYILESQLFGNVRGKRYQFQQTTGIVELLRPQEELIRTEFSETIESIADGLGKLEYSLSSQRLDAYKELYKKFKSFQKQAKGRRSEEYEHILKEHGDDQESIRLRSICFGDAAFNVKKVTGWSDSLITALSWSIGEYRGGFSDDDKYAWWPINELPIQKRPFIMIDGVSYCFDYYSLFDNIYRAIQDALFRTNALTKDNWQSQQKEASEKYVASLFARIIPSADIHRDNFYPVKASTKQMDENDIIITYDECLFAIEVKAGKFTPRPAILDYESHIKSFSDLIGRGDFQAERTINYIKNNDEAIFYNENKESQFTIRNKDYKYYYSFVVTVDNMDVFECKIQQMHFLNVGLRTLTINIDDLELYAEYFDSPLIFMHFLQERVKASAVKKLKIYDELDHLGLYIASNLYTDVVIEQCGDGIKVFVSGDFREELDQYYNGLHDPRLRVDKPSQKIPIRIKEILKILESRKLRGVVEFSSFILSWAGETKERFASNIIPLMKRQKELKRMIPMFVCGEKMMYSCYIEDTEIETIDVKLRDKYLLANLLDSSLNECWRIDLSCTKDGHIDNLDFKKLTREDIADDLDNIKEYASYISEKRKNQLVKKRWTGRKIYPNEPCSCGSGKKYKNCCAKLQRIINT